MCRNVKTLSVCPTCSEKLSERTHQQWCREGRRRGVFGRCSMGVRRSEEEFRGEECTACIEVRETQMSQMNMSEFNVKRLGWRTRKSKRSDGSQQGAELEDSDGGYDYGW